MLTKITCMESILYNISQVLGITLIHSLWQGLLIYFILKIVLAAAPQISPSKKYLMAVSSLVAIFGWFTYTLVSEINLYTWLAVKPANSTSTALMLELPVGIHQVSDEAARYYYNIEKYLPYIAIVYILGLVFNTGKLIIAQTKINTLRRAMKIDELLQQQVNKFAAMLNIGSKVNVGMSKLVDVPCMIGHFKPLILLPVTLCTYLSAAEIEAILLHELAHIKRNDYLVNFVQQLLTVLLFFNPCAMLINRVINEERENCCDDMVVEACESPALYAKALLKLEQNRQDGWKLALAANGKKFNLLHRIERIMKNKTPTPGLRPALLAMFMFAICIGSAVLLKPEIAQGKLSVKAIKPVINKALMLLAPKTTAGTQAANIAEINSAPSRQSMEAIDTNRDDHSNDYQLFGYGDAKMDSLSAELARHQKIVNDYYKTEEYKTLQQKSREGDGAESFDNDTLKNLREAFSRATDRFKQVAERTSNSAIVKKRTDIGNVIGAYYSSAEFKRINEQLERKYGIDPNINYLDGNQHPSYIKYRAALNHSMPDKIKDDENELEKLSAQQYELFSDSGEFETSLRQFKAIGDSLKTYYSKPHVKQHEFASTPAKSQTLSPEDAKKYRDQLRAYINNPEIAHERQLAKEWADKVFAYMATPEFQRHVKEWKNQLHTALGNGYDKILHPDKITGR